MTLKKVAEASARGSFFLISGQAIATAIMAVAAIIVGRLLGPDLYGEYNLALVVPQLLLLFTDLGINAGITKYSASLRAEGKKDQIKQIIRSGMLIKGFLGLVFSILNFAFAEYFAAMINRPSIGFYVQISSISIIFQVIFQASTSAFVGLDRAEYDALSTTTQAMVKTMISVALVFLGFGVAGAIIGYVAGFVVGSLVAAGVLIFKLLKPLKSEDNKSFKQNFEVLTHFGMPLYISALLTGFLPLYSQVVLAFFTSNVDIGNYRAASNFVAILGVITLPITAVLLPAFSKLDFSTSEKVRAFFKHANKYTSILVVPATMLMIILSTEIVKVLYGSTYQSASLFLAISCLSYLLVAIGYVTLTSLFNGLGETRITLRITIINVLILVLLAPVMAWAYGVPGLIVASFLSNIIATAYSAYIARKNFQVEFGALANIKVYLISAISGIPLILLHSASLPDLLTLIIGGLLYFSIYTTLIPLTKILTTSELEVAIGITHRIPLLRNIAAPIVKYQQKILSKKIGSSYREKCH